MDYFAVFLTSHRSNKEVSALAGLGWAGLAGLGWAGLAGAHLPVVEQLSRVGSWGEGDTQTICPTHLKLIIMLGF